MPMTEFANVVDGHPTRWEKKIPTTSDNKRQAHPHRPGTSRQRDEYVTVPRSRAIRTICFVCYLHDHIAPQCPYKHEAHKPEFQALFRDNFARLDEVSQAWLKQQGRLPDHARLPTEPSAAASAQPAREGPRPAPKNSPPLRHDHSQGDRGSEKTVAFEAMKVEEPPLAEN